jgi:hypothetical protein
MFEFSRFWPTDYEHGRDFVADLDKFLGQLPEGWPYGVEMRNKGWLRPEYFDCLARHNVAHVYNSWDSMLSVGEQMALPGSRTNPELVAARFLLKPGRKYEQAVKAFEPYDTIKEENPEARAAGKALIAEGQAAGPKRRTFIYVNNRLEGNAISTIETMIDSAAVAGGNQRPVKQASVLIPKTVAPFPKVGIMVGGLGVSSLCHIVSQRKEAAVELCRLSAARGTGYHPPLDAVALGNCDSKTHATIAHAPAAPGQSSPGPPP